MEMYVEQGESRRDCELKIAAKYNRPFQILREKNVYIGGFLGLFSKPAVQVEFCFSTPLRNPETGSGALMRQGNLEEAKRKVLAAASAASSNAANNSTRNVDWNNREIAANGKEAAQVILDSLNDLKKQIEQNNGKKEEHPAFVRVVELLKLNDFSDRYIKRMLDRMRKELSIEQLEDLVFVQDVLLEWIGESINIYDDNLLSRNKPFGPVSLRRPKIMILIGPTGVGKTTTVSKMAAIYGIGTNEIPAIDVKLITIDGYRICAKEQLESIGMIMRIPVAYVGDKQSLRAEIDIHREDTDLFIIDTIGKSPKDASRLGEMKEILEGAGRDAEYHLVVSASTKTSDIESIIQQFEPFNYKSVILTKMDETDHIGNLISALAEKRKSVSYITIGQGMPEDIRRASVVHFLINLEGFKVNRQKIESRFPSGDADQFRWK
ncbi:MAG: AAA family ATPase [Treponema sp.]|nr:AAA family ATPase [Treponema sp.]MCL2251352.1 AAA family ATPase [Treponema sp.]